MSNVRRVSPADAHSLLSEGYTYVDVRSEPEFAAGRPVGSINVPLLHAGPGGMAPNPEFLAVMEGAFAKDAKLVVGCKAGGRSLRAAETLLAAGFTGVVDQRAGFDGSGGPFGGGEAGWRASGLPTDAGDAPGRSYADVKARGAH